VEKERKKADAAKLREELEELPPVGRPILVIVSGLPGTGKSYFCAKLVRKKPFIILESDRLRKALFEKPDYATGESARLYFAIHYLIEQLLEEKKAVILDATNLNEVHREHLYGIAERAAAKLVLVGLDAPPKLVKERIEKRCNLKDNNSEADWAVYKKLENGKQEIKRRHYKIDTSKNNEIEKAIENIIKEIE
jgi:predicted kinase